MREEILHFIMSLFHIYEPAAILEVYLSVIQKHFLSLLQNFALRKYCPDTDNYEREP